MSIRLTLRTLLSYLDDTLEPAQAKVIGAKVAESEQARELMERIKQVTRRRRLMTPATSGPGGIDPNTIAEYLDNDVTPEQAAEVEQICLASDVHLAEVAACHQILTLVLGEPALVPPSAKQRMYALVKGPEAIPFRKPAATAGRPENDLSSEITPDHDETLRMGVPAVAGSGRQVWLLIGGGVLVVCALAFAVWQLVHNGPATNVPHKGGDQIAKGDGAKDKIEPAKDSTAAKTTDKKDKEQSEPKPPTPVEPTPEPKRSEFVQPKVESVKIPEPVVIKYAKASDKQEAIGKHVLLNTKDLAVLLQASKAEKPNWTRIANKADVTSGRPLLSLPGNKSTLILNTGVELTLWGNLFQLTLDPYLGESRAVVHASDLLDADVTLQRGRLVLRHKADKEAHVRVRFENPTLNQEEHLEVTLYGLESGLIVERFGMMDRDEAFYEKKDDPARKGEKIEDPMRKGPSAFVMVYAYGKSARVSAAQASFLMDEEQRPVLKWQSRRGVLEAPERSFTPPWLKGTPVLKEDESKKARANYVQAATEIANALVKRPINVVLAETLDDVQKAFQSEVTTKKQVLPQTRARWIYAIQCMRATDDIAGLFDIFTQPATPPFIRLETVNCLQQWIALSRDNDYLMFDVVRKYYPKTASVKIMELLHFISEEDSRKPVIYETLIEGLNNDLLPIRFLSEFHLRVLAPAGAKIPYDAAMDRPAREAAVRAWLKLIPPGRLPPMPMPMPTTKK